MISRKKTIPTRLFLLTFVTALFICCLALLGCKNAAVPTKGQANDRSNPTTDGAAELKPGIGAIDAAVEISETAEFAAESPHFWTPSTTEYHEVMTSPLSVLGSCFAPANTVSRPCVVEHYKEGTLLETETCTGDDDKLGAKLVAEDTTHFEEYTSGYEMERKTSETSIYELDGIRNTRRCEFAYSYSGQQSYAFCDDESCSLKLYDEEGRLKRELFRPALCDEKIAQAEAAVLGDFWREESSYFFDSRGFLSSSRQCSLTPRGGMEEGFDRSCTEESYQFSDAGLLMEQREYTPSGDEKSEISYEYDARGLLIKAFLNYGDRRSEKEFSYDEQGRLVELKSHERQNWTDRYDYSCRDEAAPN